MNQKDARKGVERDQEVERERGKKELKKEEKEH